MELPNCLEDYEPDLVLTIDDRRRLISNLAEDGTKSLDKFIRKYSEDKRSGIAKLVQKLRTKLDKQLNETKEQIVRKFKKKEAQLIQDQNRLEFLEQSPLAGDDDNSENSMINREIDSRLKEILLNDDTLNLIINFESESESAALERSWWERFKLAIIRFFRYLLNVFSRFAAWLRTKLGREKKKESVDKKQHKMASILINFPSGNQLWDDIDRNLDNALTTSPEVRCAIDRDLKSKGKFRGVDKGLGKSPRAGSRKTSWHPSSKSTNYRDDAKAIINQRIKRAIKREQKRLSTEFERKKRRLKKLQKDKDYLARRDRELNSRVKQVEKQREEELANLKREYQQKVEKAVKNALVNELEDAGYINKDRKKELRITTRLIDRFAEMVLSSELQKLPGKYSFAMGPSGAPHGIYEKRKLRMVAESSRMDIVDTMVNARLAHPKERHIYDSDITTHAEIRGTISHVVIVFDKSGSMEENQRITAAKKAVLALYKAVKHRNPRNVVDFIAFDSYVQVMDLLSAWQCSPSGFTNTSEALGTAFTLIRNSKADNKLIYLITDGLPEAYTDPRTGEPRAGDLDKSLNLAVSQAKRFKKIDRLKLTIVLLEPKDPLYTDAAKTIAQAAKGYVIVTDPKELATEMLTNYIEI